MNANKKQGGGGSPQLDLDAIAVAYLEGLSDGQPAQAVVLSGERWEEVKALVRRLQQENEELEQTRVQLAGCGVAALGYDLDLPKDAYGWSPSFEQVADLYRENVALRGRVEELSEALSDGVEALRLTREYVGDGLLPAVPGWSWFDWTESARALLERVVPEKETP